MTDRTPQGPRPGKRRIFGREYRTNPRRGQRYVFVGLAVLFLLGWSLYRQSCSDRVGQTFGTVTEHPSKDAGIHSRRPRPMKTDPEDW